LAESMLLAGVRLPRRPEMAARDPLEVTPSSTSDTVS
jgi:hypothetical protein